MPPKVEYVYVAGPITKGGEFRNVRKAIDEGSVLLNAGYIPFIPHLTCFWDILIPNDYESWLKYDFRWIERCDALLRIPGKSTGANREVTFATMLGKEVVFGGAEALIKKYGRGPNASSTD